MPGYTPGEQPREPGIIKLNTNENPYPPSPRTNAALAHFPPASLRLYPDPVSSHLRESIAAYHKCTVDHIFVGNGSDEVLALCTRAFVEDAGAIGYFDPSYSLYPVLADIAGRTRRPVDLDAHFGWAMPANYEASLFFLTNPNAPTSIQYARGDVENFCRTFDGVVVVDEAYVDFARYHCADLALSLPNVLVARTLSKSYSLAGLRVGYALGPAPLIAAMYTIKDSYNLDRLAQTLAQAAIEDPAWMRQHAEKIIATRERTAEALRRHHFFVAPSDTNFLWIKPPDGFSAQILFGGLRDRHILTRYFSTPRTRDFLRVTIGTDDQMDAFLNAISAIMKNP